MAFSPLLGSRILASQSLSGSSLTTPRPGPGAQAKVPFQSWACCRLFLPGPRNPLGLAKFVSPLSHDSLVSASAHLLLSFSWSSALSSPSHPGCNSGHHPCPRTSPESQTCSRPALGPPSLAMAVQYQGSLCPAWRKALGFHLPDRQLRLQRRSNLTEAESSGPGLAACHNSPAWGTPPPPTPGNQFLRAPPPSHSWSPGAARQLPAAEQSWAAAAFLGVCCRLTL